VLGDGQTDGRTREGSRDLAERAFGLVVRALDAESLLSLHQTFLDDRQRQLRLAQRLLQDPDVLLYADHVPQPTQSQTADSGVVMNQINKITVLNRQNLPHSIDKNFLPRMLHMDSDFMNI